MGKEGRVSLPAHGRGTIHVNVSSNDVFPRFLELILGGPFDG